MLLTTISTTLLVLQIHAYSLDQQENFNWASGRVDEKDSFRPWITRPRFFNKRLVYLTENDLVDIYDMLLKEPGADTIAIDYDNLQAKNLNEGEANVQYPVDVKHREHSRIVRDAEETQEADAADKDGEYRLRKGNSDTEDEIIHSSLDEGPTRDVLDSRRLGREQQRWGRFGGDVSNGQQPRWGRFGREDIHGGLSKDIPKYRRAVARRDTGPSENKSSMQWSRFGRELADELQPRWGRFGDGPIKRSSQRWGSFGREAMKEETSSNPRWGRFGRESDEVLAEPRWGRFGRDTER